jgi:hypothetical protein
MKSFIVKDASAFPVRPSTSYRAHLEALRQGKCVEIPVTSRDEARKIRISLRNSIGRWLTNGELLKTAISDKKVSVVLDKKQSRINSL